MSEHLKVLADIDGVRAQIETVIDGYCGEEVDGPCAWREAAVDRLWSLYGAVIKERDEARHAKGQIELRYQAAEKECKALAKLIAERNQECIDRRDEAANKRIAELQEQLGIEYKKTAHLTTAQCMGAAYSGRTSDEAIRLFRANGAKGLPVTYDELEKECAALRKALEPLVHRPDPGCQCERCR